MNYFRIYWDYHKNFFRPRQIYSDNFEIRVFRRDFCCITTRGIGTYSGGCMHIQSANSRYAVNIFLCSAIYWLGYDSWGVGRYNSHSYGDGKSHMTRSWKFYHSRNEFHPRRGNFVFLSGSFYESCATLYE